MFARCLYTLAEQTRLDTSHICIHILCYSPTFSSAEKKTCQVQKVPYQNVSSLADKMKDASEHLDMGTYAGQGV